MFIKIGDSYVNVKYLRGISKKGEKEISIILGKGSYTYSFDSTIERNTEYFKLETKLEVK